MEERLTSGRSVVVEIVTVTQDQDMSVYRIDLDIPIPGFRHFITPWVIFDNGQNLTTIVDPGPASGIPSLLSALTRIGVKRIDTIFLTHIHLDHAGGVGHLCAEHPDAIVIVHERGMRHLSDPKVLWEKSVETLGSDVAQAYGEMLPLPVETQITDQAPKEHLHIVKTPGHAPHHQSLVYQGTCETLLFAGEAAGVFLSEDYQRPATPPRFIRRVYVDSIGSLKKEAAHAKLFLGGHFGFAPDPMGILDRAETQIHLWHETVIRMCSQGGLDTDELSKRCVDELIQSDPMLQGFDDLPPDIRDREMYFLQNSAKGMILAHTSP